MPIIECGFGPLGPFGAAQLQATGPTISVNIGFDPVLLTQLSALAVRGSATGGGPPAPAPSAAPPPAGAIPSPAAPAPGLAPAAQQSTSVQNVPALIDTGAHASCIDEALAQQLQLPLINQVQQGGVHGQGTLNVYLGYIGIPLLGAGEAGFFVGARMNFPGEVHRAIIGRTLLRNTLLVYDGRIGSVKLAH